MFHRLHRFIVAAGAAAAVTSGAMVPRPASADTTSTIITAAGIIGAIILYNNYQHKRDLANQQIGYSRNGGVVYGDGRVVMPNGAVYYPDANGDYNYDARYGYNGEHEHHDNGRHNGWYKNHHEHEHEHEHEHDD